MLHTVQTSSLYLMPQLEGLNALLCSDPCSMGLELVYIVNASHAVYALFMLDVYL